MNEVTASPAPAPVMRGPNDYKSDVKPVWCPGCGDFGVVNALAKAMARMASRHGCFRCGCSHRCRQGSCSRHSTA